MLGASLVASGDTLSGRVVDRGGRAVAGATVVVVELHRVAITPADGTFRLADVPPGRYTVSVRGLGFAPSARHVSMTGGGPSTLDITLERTSVWFEPVTVTATQAPLESLSYTHPHS